MTPEHKKAVLQDLHQMVARLIDEEEKPRVFEAPNKDMYAAMLQLRQLLGLSVPTIGDNLSVLLDECSERFRQVDADLDRAKAVVEALGTQRANRYRQVRVPILEAMRGMERVIGGLPTLAEDHPLRVILDKMNIALMHLDIELKPGWEARIEQATPPPPRHLFILELPTQADALMKTLDPVKQFACHVGASLAGQALSGFTLLCQLTDPDEIRWLAEAVHTHVVPKEEADGDGF